MCRYQQQENKHKDGGEAEKISPESVEVIPEEEDDEEDMSVADDSYTSASESTATATTTIMEQPPGSFMSTGKSDSEILRSPHHKPYSIAEPTSSNESSLYSSTVSLKTDSGEMKSPLASTKTSQHSLNLLDSSFNESLVLSEVQPKGRVEEPILTHGSGRAGLTLALPHGDVSLTASVVPASEESSVFVDSLVERGDGSRRTAASGADSSNEEGGSLLSDSRTLVPTDSSCDGASVMGSSSEETVVTTVIDDSFTDETMKASLHQTSSYYVKTMLADAMGEEMSKDSRTDQHLSGRDQSPISSERLVSILFM